MSMKIFEGIQSFTAPDPGVALTIGNFDGVHLGHQALIDAARTLAAPRSAPVVVMTFDPHPLSVLFPERAPQPITTLSERLALLERAGADMVILLRSDPAFLSLSAEEFLQTVVAPCRPRAIVEGPTFNFGRGRGGSIDTLREHGAMAGYQTIVVDERRAERLDGRPAINSSAIRAAISQGRVNVAAEMLGRPHRVQGRVTRGQGRGTPLGFPTANLDEPPQITPAFGVYSAVAQLDDGRLFLSAVNVGPQPTFDQQRPRIEAHLLDFSGDLLGQALGLHLLDRLRGQARFASVEALTQQVRLDIARTREWGSALERLRAAPPISLVEVGKSS